MKRYVRNSTQVKAISAKQAEVIGERTGFPITYGNGRTFYATTVDETDLFEFYTKAERDAFVARNNKG